MALEHPALPQYTQTEVERWRTWELPQNLAHGSIFKGMHSKAKFAQHTRTVRVANQIMKLPNCAVSSFSLLGSRWAAGVPTLGQKIDLNSPELLFLSHNLLSKLRQRKLYNCRHGLARIDPESTLSLDSEERGIAACELPLKNIARLRDEYRLAREAAVAAAESPPAWQSIHSGCAAESRAGAVDSTQLTAEWKRSKRVYKHAKKAAGPGPASGRSRPPCLLFQWDLHPAGCSNFPATWPLLRNGLSTRQGQASPPKKRRKQASPFSKFLRKAA